MNWSKMTKSDKNADFASFDHSNDEMVSNRYHANVAITATTNSIILLEHPNDEMFK